MKGITLFTTVLGFMLTFLLFIFVVKNYLEYMILITSSILVIDLFVMFIICLRYQAKKRKRIREEEMRKKIIEDYKISENEMKEEEKK